MTQVGHESKLVPIKDSTQETWDSSINRIRENLKKLEGFNPAGFGEMDEGKKFEIRVLMNDVFSSVDRMDSLLV